MQLENSYLTLPERFYQELTPQSFPDSELLKFNYTLAKELGLEIASDKEILEYFSGQKLLPGSRPAALAYAAHQFGHFVLQLGDGRAHLLGDINGMDLQLKGSGQTMFSRRGDGRSALGPVIREYIVSEGMFHLGVKTTRALCAVKTNETVYREYEEPGGVFTRVAPGHIRVGTFQYFASRQDREGLELLLNYAVEKYYPQHKDLEINDKAIEFLKEVTLAQADLVAHWMSLGFIHGVMNTDNFTVGGFSLDFGPCAFMDEYKFDKVFSSIDRNGRYAYNNQISIAQWNILRLAECLIELIHEDTNKAIKAVEFTLAPLMEEFEDKRWQKMAKKFGLKTSSKEDINCMQIFLDYLEKEGLDFTLSFRELKKFLLEEENYLKKTPLLNEFKSKMNLKDFNVDQLDQINPLYIPRNHWVEKAIQDVYQDNFKTFHDMCEVLEKPFVYQEKFNHFSNAPTPDERVTKTFCGT